MAYLSMNLFFAVITLFLISNIVDAAVNCQNQLLWSQSLPDYYSSILISQEYGTVALSPDGSTVFAAVYSGNGADAVYLVGTATDGSGNAVVYSTHSADDVFSSPVFVNSTTIAWTTYNGGSHSQGSLVLTNIETKTSTIIYLFGASQDSGSFPYAITFDSNSNTIYGITELGGASNGGVMFSYNLQNSQYQALYTFASNDAIYAIVLSNNALYVTLGNGGSNGGGYIGFYNLTTSSFTELYNFTEGGDSGYNPVGAVAVSSSGDVLYGTTFEGGSNGDGTLFSLNINGTSEFTALFYFNSNAASPYGGLVLDETNGLLYGTVLHPNGGVFVYNLNTNEMSFLYLFTSTGGNVPYSGVALSADKTTLYGITTTSGSNEAGPAVFYALNASCIAPPVTTTATPTTTAPPTTTTAPPTTTSSPSTHAPSTTTSTPQSLSSTTSTSTPTQSVTYSFPKTGFIHRFDSSSSLAMSLILSLAALVLFY